VRLNSCVRQSQSPCSSASLCEPPTERFGVHVVREDALAVDLDHGQPLAVAPFEVGIAGDVDLLQLEALFDTQRGQLRPGALAEVAVRRVVERDPDYG
jgi:hypothetical protein